ncbi:unnamed protein product [Parascedosporium putredinis]|uniref:WW domain-containing protein n=1 Tax=Parascedosporium putredinis TaxID=1442378 RepID=A0A9P1MAM4_9PEZI|nr:unnamed protein product [Parascedosporium putredinis]CAI7993042.1 unnamed protein product [Parascedosporium putredinis]
MPDLPVGWDIDYDGNRWFYRYKSTGLIQYTFPKEGDEFPEYVDASTPIPTLAPEERLESQQQMRRRGAGSSVAAPTTSARSRGPVMSATGEEDETAILRGPVPGRSGGTTTETLSPPESSVPTPSIMQSTPVIATPDIVAPPASDPSPEPPNKKEEEAAPAPGPASPDVPMLDSRDLPYELPETTSFNPVGVIAEMPTETTAMAHIELHPDPVEMGDNTVLAPIETFMMEAGLAELPTHRSPTDNKAMEVEEPPRPRRVDTGPRVYPFQPKDDEDPNQPPTPLGPPATSQATMAGGPPSATQEGNGPAGFTAFHPSANAAQQQAPAPLGPGPAGGAPVATAGPPAAVPPQNFKITRKPTNAGTKPPGFRPWTPGTTPDAAPPGPVSRTATWSGSETRGDRIGSVPQDDAVSIMSTSQPSQAPLSNPQAAPPAILTPPSGPVQQMHHAQLGRGQPLPPHALQPGGAMQQPPHGFGRGILPPGADPRPGIHRAETMPAQVQQPGPPGQFQAFTPPKNTPTSEMPPALGTAHNQRPPIAGGAAPVLQQQQQQQQQPAAPITHAQRLQPRPHANSLPSPQTQHAGQHIPPTLMTPGSGDPPVPPSGRSYPEHPLPTPSPFEMHRPSPPSAGGSPLSNRQTLLPNPLAIGNASPSPQPHSRSVSAQSMPPTGQIATHAYQGVTNPPATMRSIVDSTIPSRTAPRPADSYFPLQSQPAPQPAPQPLGPGGGPRVPHPQQTPPGEDLTDRRRSLPPEQMMRLLRGQGQQAQPPPSTVPHNLAPTHILGPVESAQGSPRRSQSVAVRQGQGAAQPLPPPQPSIPQPTVAQPAVTRPSEPAAPSVEGSSASIAPVSVPSPTPQSGSAQQTQHHAAPSPQVQVAAAAAAAAAPAALFDPPSEPKAIVGPGLHAIREQPEQEVAGKPRAASNASQFSGVGAQGRVMVGQGQNQASAGPVQGRPPAPHVNAVPQQVPTVGQPGVSAQGETRAGAPQGPIQGAVAQGSPQANTQGPSQPQPPRAPTAAPTTAQGQAQGPLPAATQPPGPQPAQPHTAPQGLPQGYVIPQNQPQQTPPPGFMPVGAVQGQPPMMMGPGQGQFQQFQQFPAGQYPGMPAQPLMQPQGMQARNVDPQSPASQGKDKGRWYSKFIKPSKTLQKSPPPQNQFQVPPPQQQQQQQPMGWMQQGSGMAPQSFAYQPQGAPQQFVMVQGMPQPVPPGFQQMQGMQFYGHPQMMQMPVGMMQPGAPGAPLQGPPQGQPGAQGIQVPQAAGPGQPAPGTPTSPVVSVQQQGRRRSQVEPPSPESVRQRANSAATSIGSSKTQMVSAKHPIAESVESDRGSISTMDVAEAQAQPVLKPQVIQVSRPLSMQNQRVAGQDLTPLQAPIPAQIIAAAVPIIPAPAASPSSPTMPGQPGVPANGYHGLQPSAPFMSHIRVPSHDSPVVSAQPSPSVRESMVSEISSADSADSRRVSVMSVASGPMVAGPGPAGVATQRNAEFKAKMARKPMADYSGGGWGDDGE